MKAGDVPKIIGVLYANRKDPISLVFHPCERSYEY